MCLTRNDNSIDARRVNLHRRIGFTVRDDQHAQDKALAMSPLYAIPAHVDHAKDP
jgi:hypothetical protein